MKDVYGIGLQLSTDGSTDPQDLFMSHISLILVSTNFENYYINVQKNHEYTMIKKGYLR